MIAFGIPIAGPPVPRRARSSRGGAAGATCRKSLPLKADGVYGRDRPAKELLDQGLTKGRHLFWSWFDGHPSCILVRDVAQFNRLSKVATIGRHQSRETLAQVGLPADLTTDSHRMDRRPLIATNPYLKIPGKYRKALIINVSSSTAVETGAPVESIARSLTQEGQRKQIKRSQGS